MRTFVPALAVALTAASPALSQVVLADYGAMLGMDDAEITPDGRLAVVRENSTGGALRVYEMATGAELARLACVHDGFPILSGDSAETVAVTNDRAVVLGQCTLVVDLNSLTVLSDTITGNYGREVVLTPDGSMAAVRGGEGPSGGLYIYDVQSGIQLASAPGSPPPIGSPNFEVATAVATNDHAVFLSYREDGQGDERARVTIFDLNPSGGGAPTVVYETMSAGADADQDGIPHDLELTPDGQFVAVRSEDEIALYSLAGAQSGRVWEFGLVGDPGPFNGACMDSVEVTDDFVATISRDTNGVVGAQVDLITIGGVQRHDDIAGDPHDLVITPDGTKLIVRTSAGAFLYDLTNPPAGADYPFASMFGAFSTHTSFVAGLDSIEATNELAVGLFRQNDDTRIEVWDISAGTLAPVVTRFINEPPVDLAFSPNGRWLGVSGLSRVAVLDLITGERVLNHDANNNQFGWPWGNGVVLNDEGAVAFGYIAAQAGWVSVLDLSPGSSYCTGAPNSVGPGATIYATRTPSVGANHLRLRAFGLPANRPGLFLYGTNQIMAPFGDGFRCVGGTVRRFIAQTSDAAGVARRGVDFNGPNATGGAITAGSTWNLQYFYRDPAGPGGNGFNLSDAITIDFVN